jgi:hypothetical protein
MTTGHIAVAIALTRATEAAAEAKRDFAERFPLHDGWRIGNPLVLAGRRALQ